MAYSPRKKKGSLGQQQKAYALLTSRKIVCVKVFSQTDDDTIFVKGLIKKSYGDQAYPATIQFQDSDSIKSIL